MAGKPFKISQDNLWIRFGNDNPQDKELKKQLRQYFDQSDRKTQSDDIKQLLKLGLQVANGQYHDHELVNIENQIHNLYLSMNTYNQISENIIQALGDVQDAITGQQSDVDAIITPKTKRSS